MTRQIIAGSPFGPRPSPFVSKLGPQQLVRELQCDWLDRNLTLLLSLCSATQCIIMYVMVVHTHATFCVRQLINRYLLYQQSN